MKVAPNKVISVNWALAKKWGKTRFIAKHKHLVAEKQLSDMFDEKFGKPKKEAPETEK